MDTNTKNQLSKHARKALKNGRRRDVKCDRRALQRDLRGLASIISSDGEVLSGKHLAERVLDEERYHGVTVVSEQGRVL